jgi:hypothetical protein
VNRILSFYERHHREVDAVFYLALYVNLAFAIGDSGLQRAAYVVIAASAVFSQYGWAKCRDEVVMTSLRSVPTDILTEVEVCLRANGRAAAEASAHFAKVSRHHRLGKTAYSILADIISRELRRRRAAKKGGAR